MSELITDTRTRLETFISESFPTVDISPGSVLSELLIKLAATLHNPIKNDIDALQQTNSIVEAIDSVEDTYSDVVSNIATNYSVVRNAGNKATGKLKVTLNSSDTFYLDAGSTFYQPVLKLSFVTTGNYKITTRPVNATDIALRQSNGSTLYYFILPVEAENVGSSYKLQDQTSLGLAPGTTIEKFVDAKVYGNFAGGLDMETDKELINRFQTGLSHRTFLSKDSIFHQVNQQFPGLQDISLVTANDPELIRSKQNVFGISTLGMVDVYVKTTFGLETTILPLVGTKTATGEWSLNLGVDDAAGFYKIVSILPQNSNLIGSLLFTIAYDYNNLGYATANLLNNLYEARFTKYQTAVVTLAFDETSMDGVSVEVPIGTQQQFDVLVAHQPYIKEIQDQLLDSANRILCADYLIKAALPCFVTINLKIVRKDSTVEFPVDLLKQDIYKYINSLPFGEDLHASAIINLCHKYNIKNVQLPVVLSGDIYTDHSTVFNISSTDALSIPTKLDLGISKKTTTFISNYFNQGVDPGSDLTDAIGIEIV